MKPITILPHHERLQPGQVAAFRQLAFQLNMGEDARAELDNALYRLTSKPDREWLFVRISPEQFRYVSQAIRNCRNVATTFSVWNSAITHLRMDTGEVMVGRRQLASEAGIHPNHVSTAMADLERIGAILRKRRGKHVVYFVNPNVGWNGSEGSRQAAAKEAQKLHLVVNNDTPSKD